MCVIFIAANLKVAREPWLVASPAGSELVSESMKRHVCPNSVRMRQNGRRHSGPCDTVYLPSLKRWSTPSSISCITTERHSRNVVLSRKDGFLELKNISSKINASRSNPFKTPSSGARFFRILKAACQLYPFSEPPLCKIHRHRRF